MNFGLELMFSVETSPRKYSNCITISSVQFSRSVMSDSLRPHESQHTRPPCPSPTPGIHTDSRPSSQWCHPAISSFVVPFSSCPQSLPALESFPMSQLFPWGGQSTGVSALASFLPKKSQGWSPSEWTGWISLQSKGLSRVFSKTTVQKPSILRRSAFFTVQLSHPYMTTGKTVALTRRTFVETVGSNSQNKNIWQTKTLNSEGSVRVLKQFLLCFLFGLCVMESQLDEGSNPN